MTSKSRTLLLIAGFVTLSLGSFVWFILSWDPSKEEPVVRGIPQFEQVIA